MKILVVHHTLNSCGGGERVALHLINALTEAGYDVELGTVERTDWSRVSKIMGIELPRIPREHSVAMKLRRFGIYQRALTAIHVARFRKRFDLVINTHGDVMPLPTDITYLHFPVFALLAKEPWMYYTKYLKSVFWRAYFEPYRLMQWYLARKFFTRSVLLTNSKFSRDVIRKYIGSNAMIIYPPVEISEYVRSSRNAVREDAVIIISRFSPEKNLHLIPHIAKELPKAKFYVVGSVRAFQSWEYYQRIESSVEKLGVNNVKLIADAPHGEKLKLLSRSKVFLHLMPYEHFGIAVVEAMASGCLPVVHKSGGQWGDIVDNGRYGLGYDRLSPSEVALVVEEALNRWTPKLATDMVSRAELFSDERFRREMLRVVEKCAGS